MTKFPMLPAYHFSWRSILVEPSFHSGERICVGLVVKGEDRSPVAMKVLPVAKLKALFGAQYASRIAEAINLCVKNVETFYQFNQLSKSWVPTFEGFYLGPERESFADDFESAVNKAAFSSSAYIAALEIERSLINLSPSISTPETWRRNIYNAVISRRAELADMFERKVNLRTRSSIGISVKFGFLSPTYAAHFDAMSISSGLQSSLMRAQSKLWQLDLLRDHLQLFKPQQCELIFQVPEVSAGDNDLEVREFVEELSSEAGRKGIGLFATASFEEAALRVIGHAA